MHHKFAYPGRRVAQVARKALGLDPKSSPSSSTPVGRVAAIFSDFPRVGSRGELDVQAIFLAGRNEELKADAESLAEGAAFPVKVIGYSEHVEELMGAANVMISKLGGLTTFEAFACRLPIIADAITEPMPQEAGTASLLVKRGAGVLLRRAGDIVPVIRRMVEDTTHYSAMRAATIGLAIPNATRHIVEEIAALIPAASETPERVVPAEIVAA